MYLLETRCENVSWKIRLPPSHRVEERKKKRVKRSEKKKRTTGKKEENTILLLKVFVPGTHET